MIVKHKYLMIALILCLTMIVLTGCVPGDGTNNAQNPAGFLWGIWHGWVAPISLIIGVFNENIRLYETYNFGWRYDLGFYIAVISGFGGISFFRRKKGNRD